MSNKNILIMATVGGEPRKKDNAIFRVVGISIKKATDVEKVKFPKNLYNSQGALVQITKWLGNPENF